MKVTELDVDQIIPYVNNPRDNTAAIDAVASSIREFGFNVPLVLDRERVIVTGHTRLAAARKLGLKKVPCIIAEHLTDAQAKAFRLADNRVSELATWDKELLDLELRALDELNFDMTDFGFEELEKELGDPNQKQEVTEDNPPEPDEESEPMTSPGDVSR